MLVTAEQVLPGVSFVAELHG